MLQFHSSIGNVTHLLSRQTVNSGFSEFSFGAFVAQLVQIFVRSSLFFAFWRNSKTIFPFCFWAGLLFSYFLTISSIDKWSNREKRPRNELIEGNWDCKKLLHRLNYCRQSLQLKKVFFPRPTRKEEEKNSEKSSEHFKISTNWSKTTFRFCWKNTREMLSEILASRARRTHGTRISEG